MPNKDEEFDAQFVASWMRAKESNGTLDDIAEDLRISKTYVINKAQTLRKHGVNLPHMRANRYTVTPEHAASLNAMIDTPAHTIIEDPEA